MINEQGSLYTLLATLVHNFDQGLLLEARRGAITRFVRVVNYFDRCSARFPGWERRTSRAHLGSIYYGLPTPYPPDYPLNVVNRYAKTRYKLIT